MQTQAPEKNAIDPREYVNNIRFELGTITRTDSPNFGKPTARLIRKAKNLYGEKTVAGHYFPTEQARQNWIDIKTKEAADRVAGAAKRAEELKTVKAGFTNPYKVGDILVASWGYDQTNIDFYQVTGLTAKGVKFRELCQNEVPGEGISPLAGYTTPIKDSFRARSGGGVCKEEFRAIQVYVGSNGISNCISYDGHFLRIWNGKPQYASHYA
ncbi:MAG: hypothetical protein V4498_02840 [candidate division FCPU426 bacterium]